MVQWSAATWLLTLYEKKVKKLSKFVRHPRKNTQAWSYAMSCVLRHPRKKKEALAYADMQVAWRTWAAWFIHFIKKRKKLDVSKSWFLSFFSRSHSEERVFGNRFVVLLQLYDTLLKKIKLIRLLVRGYLSSTTNGARRSLNLENSIQNQTEIVQCMPSFSHADQVEIRQNYQTAHFTKETV